MAQYETHRTCGHTETVNLFGKVKKRFETIEWLETQPCTACKRAQEQAMAREAAEKAGRIQLEGTEKQVAWATEIRETFFTWLDRQPKETIDQTLTILDKRLYAERPENDPDSIAWREAEAEKIKAALIANEPNLRQAIESQIRRVANSIASAKEWIENRMNTSVFVADLTAVSILGRDVDNAPVTFPAGTFGKCKNGVFWLATTGFVEATDQKFRCELAFVKAGKVTENPDGTISMSRRVAQKALDDAADRTNANALSYVTVTLRGANIE
ncbi:MAG: hypothetical protein IJG38_00165 [Thermoguttaceae bacterium]|nr:hypothetical protein [Thermoguttaceae bacterium]